ncbi:MAG TPA: MoxR family ATPase [Acidimicrobiales bacterium]|nr:MoxR family ATPase [Acidimicrobiales bacterium]
MTATIPLAQTRLHAAAILDEVERAVVGKRPILELLLAGMLADGHILLEDFPGVAKTLIARSFSEAIDASFTRIQFTPDLLPGDVTGSSIYDARTAQFEFRPGPVFTNLLLADEINRATPKAQSALLEAMQERQVTVDGATHVLERPFLVLATQNPIELEGTYPLPEAQLDRFMLRLSVGYPTEGGEWDIVQRRLARRQERLDLRAVIDRATFVAMQASLEDVYVSDAVGQYVVAIVRSTRERGTVSVGASPRGTLAVTLAARAVAVLRERDFVTPDDVKTVAVSALAHRVTLRPELWMRGTRPEQVVRECLDSVPAPPPEHSERPRS